MVLNYTQKEINELKELPAQRNICLKAGQSNHGLTQKQRASYMVAGAAYIVGNPATEPCKQCTRGVGPFVGCVVVGGLRKNGSRFLLGACANCLYGDHGGSCSFRK